MEFFSDTLLLEGACAKKLYDEVKELPIIDYHCHLNQKDIAENLIFDNLGELWLRHDHYKWRAMRMCGIEEKYITGAASWEEKFLKFASIMPMLFNNPLYYWCHLELKLVFGINQPLNVQNAREIYQLTAKKLHDLTIQKLLAQFKVEYIATTDNPYDNLELHQKYGNTLVTPTFRPDKLLTFDPFAIDELSKVTKINIDSYCQLKEALALRLKDFIAVNGRLADHGFLDFPKSYLSDEMSAKTFLNYENASCKERDGLFGNLLMFLMEQYSQNDFIVQIHFSVHRNVNKEMYDKTGSDSGFDTMSSEVNYQSFIKFMNMLPIIKRPTIILYSLNPNALIPLTNIANAFTKVYIGAPWWFNDTLNGIKSHLQIMSEYGCLGTNLGMLTDSRSYLSYVRFDFFRRILASFIGLKVDNGEYPLDDAIKLIKDICYYNIKKMLKI